MRARSLVGSLVLLAMMALGCSGGTGAPTSPSEPASTPQVAPVAGRLPDGVAGLGGYSALLHPDTLTAELTPWREAEAVGDVYNEIGLTSFLRGSGNFTITGVRLVDTDTLGVTVETTHPFALDKRPDLSVFNLKMHVVTQGIDQFGPLVTNATFLENPDGYSTLWDLQADRDRTTAANLHPYRILSDDPSRQKPFDPLAPAGWNVWAPGATHTDELLVHIEGSESIEVDLYLTADYGQSATRATRFVPVYDLPRFAGKAPWKIDVAVRDNLLAANDLDSTATLDVSVWDWGHSSDIGTDVVEVSAWAPALGDPVNVVPPAVGPADPLLVSVDLVNAAGAPEGTYPVLVTALDEASGSALEDDLATAFDVPTYATYQLLSIAVGPPTGNAPVAVISEPCQEVTYFPAGEPIPLSGLGSTDVETPEDQLLYDWDLDWSGLPAEFEANRTGRDIEWSPPLGTSGPRTIGLRVTDLDGLAGFASIDIQIADVPGGPFTNRVNMTNSPDREEDIGRAQTGFDRDHVIADANGKLHVFSLTEFFDTEVTTYDPATGLSDPPLKLYETQFLYSVPIVRMAPDGTIHLLYMAADDFDDNGYVLPTIETRTYDPVARSVSAATVLAEWQTPNPIDPANNIPHMQGISFDINSQGEMVAIYEEWWWTYVSGEFAPQYAHQMFYVRNPGTGWEAPVEVPWTIFTAKLDSPEIGAMRSRPDLRATGDDRFHAIYINNPEADEDGPIVLYHRTYDFDTDLWGTASEAHNSGTKYSYKQLQLFPAFNGDLVLLHQKSFNQIFYQRYDSVAATWSVPSLMADQDTSGGIAWQSIATAAITDSGLVFVAFQALNPAPLDDLEELYYSWFPLTATADEVLNAPKVPIEICYGPEGQREPQFGIDKARNRMYLVYENPEDVPENDLWVASKSLP